MVFKLLHRCDEDLWTVWCIMMTLLTADGTVLPVQEDALTDVHFHVGLCRLCTFPGAVTEWAL